MINQTVYDRLVSSSSLVALVEDRIQDTIPTPNTTKWPVLTYLLSDGKGELTFDGKAGLTFYTISINAFSALSVEEAITVRDTANEMLDQWRAGSVEYCELQGSDEGEAEIGGYLATATYTLTVNEAHIVAVPGNNSVIRTGVDSITLETCGHILELNCEGLTLDNAPVGGNVDLSNYARLDQSNSFNGNQEVIGVLNASSVSAGSIFAEMAITSSGDLTAQTAEIAEELTAGLFTGDGSGLTNLPVGSLSGTVAITQGGTGETTAANAINALVPSQTGNSLKMLTTNGTAVSWSTDASALKKLNASELQSGTVSDVRLSANIPRLNASNSFSEGPQTITPSADANKGLVINAHSTSQSANLTEWTKGTITTSITPDGRLTFADSSGGLNNRKVISWGSGTYISQFGGDRMDIGSGNSWLQINSGNVTGETQLIGNNNRHLVLTISATNKSVVAKGIDSQTSPIFQIQNSSASPYVSWSSTGNHSIGNGKVINWSSTGNATGTADVGIKRQDVNLIQITDGDEGLGSITCDVLNATEFSGSSADITTITTSNINGDVQFSGSAVLYNGNFTVSYEDSGVFTIASSDDGTPHTLIDITCETLTANTSQAVNISCSQFNLTTTEASGLAILGTGEIQPAQIDDTSATNNSIYYSTDASKLVYKDSGGTVHNLY